MVDPDPVVRKMAEQDLLAMGYSAEDYLTAQRAKASPELKEAIDRIWERIIRQEEKRKRHFGLNVLERIPSKQYALKTA